MPTEKKITYLLGAGASAQALPVVKDIPRELELMMAYVEWYDDRSNISLRKSKKFSETYKQIELLKDHASIDTLARKYWLRSQQNLSDENYVRVKNLMTSLILFKQLDLAHSTELPHELVNLYHNRKKYQRLDYRYDSLLASIVQNNFMLPDNINIISWNYDFQIEKAFNFYYQLENLVEVGNRLGIAYNNVHTVMDKIIKLNGTAFFQDNTTLISSFSSYNDSMHSLFVRALENNIDSTIASRIRFAWETESDVTTQSRNLACDVITNSNHVVVIGYSFPIFNREVDIQLLKNFTGTVHVQDIPERVDQIQNQLDAINTRFNKNKKVELQRNTDQFLIPNEYWINPPRTSSLSVKTYSY